VDKEWPTAGAVSAGGAAGFSSDKAWNPVANKTNNARNRRIHDHTRFRLRYGGIFTGTMNFLKPKALGLL